MHIVTRFLTIACLIAIASPSALAQQLPAPSDPSHLTSRGRVMIGGSIGGNWSDDSVAAPWLYDKWRLYGRPSATLFVKDHVGVGATLGGGMSGGHNQERNFDYRSSDLSIGAHAVLELPLTRNVGWVAIPAVSYAWLKYSFDLSASWANNPQLSMGLPSQPREFTAHLVRMSMSLPLLIHLSDHVGIGFGPDVWLDVFLAREPKLPNSNRETRLQLGASSWIAVSF